MFSFSNVLEERNFFLLLFPPQVGPCLLQKARGAGDGGEDYAKKEKYWGECGLGPGRRRPSKLDLGSSTARKLETRNLGKLAETKSHFPHPGGGGIPGPRSQPWLHKTHFQVAALLPSVNPSRGLPIYSTRDLVRPKPRESRGGPGEAQRLLSWGPCWRTSPLELALCNLLAFSRSPPTEVKALRAPGTPRAGVGGSGAGVFVSPAGFPTGARDRVPLGSASRALDVWLDTGAWAAARGSPEPW